MIIEINFNKNLIESFRFIPKIPTHANMTALPPQLNPSAVAHGAMMANDFTRRAPVNVARTSAGNMIPVMNPSPVTSVIEQ